MSSVSAKSSAIVRTERGLTIAGTRITLYDVMDYVAAQYPFAFIRSWLHLTEEQMNAALAYISENRSEVEREYQWVLEQTEDIQQYWEKRNREHFARIGVKPTNLDREALREKLRTQMKKHDVEL